MSLFLVHKPFREGHAKVFQHSCRKSLIKVLIYTAKPPNTEPLGEDESSGIGRAPLIGIGKWYGIGRAPLIGIGKWYGIGRTGISRFYSISQIEHLL